MSVTPIRDNLAQTNEFVICLERKSTPKIITLIKQICCNFENSTGKRRPTCTNQHESHSPYQGGNSTFLGVIIRENINKEQEKVKQRLFYRDGLC